MISTDDDTETRLQSVLTSVPSEVLDARAADKLARLCIDLDTVGRLDGRTGDPLVDRHSLLALLRSILDAQLATRLVAMLESLPQHHLRLPVVDELPPTEVGWYELAERVVIFDTTPESTYAQLNVAWRQSTDDVIDAVYDAFPSLEKEMIDPDNVPTRLMKLVEQEGGAHFFAKLTELDRQLGWWAALTGVLLVPLATLSRTLSATDSVHRNAWPLGIFALAAGVGGWTLTVVESIVLAPVD